MENLKPITKVDGIIRKFCYTIGMIPTTYLLSLTYEEQILAIGKYLDDTVYPAINKNAEATEELQNLYKKLRYELDNLDVQEEVNAKLEAMKESGELENLLTNYLDLIKVYSTTEAMINDAEHISEGQKIKTLGYYEVNDGGQAEFIITNSIESNKIQIEVGNLYATLIVKDYVNVKSVGAYGDNINDDTEVIQKCLNSKYNVFIPNGEYLVTETLIIPVNKIVKGENRKTTIIKGDIERDYIIKYGLNYDYNGYAGAIKNLRLETNYNSDKPYGIYLNSGCVIENVDFYKISKCIDRVSNYIDLITIKNIYCGYCEVDNDYIIKLSGNQDALVLDQIKIAKDTNNDTDFNGIYVDRCHGGSLTNSILNFNIKINQSNAFTVENVHCENIEDTITIVDSCVTFNNCLKYKNTTKNDIVLQSTNYDKICSAEFNNVVFYTTGANYNFNNLVEEFNELGNNTILKLNKVYRQFNFADKGRTTYTAQGILIKNNSLFNLNSGKLSKEALLVNNIIKTDIQYNEGLINSGSLGSATKSNIAQWKGLETNSLNYRCVVILDEERKLIAGYSNNLNITEINTTTAPVIGINPQWGQDIILFRGNSTSSYTNKCIIPNCSRTLLIDNYYSVNGYAWQDIEAVNPTSAYKRIEKYKRNGNNVIIESDSAPTLGNWTKGDKVINTNPTAGNPYCWIYNGTQWLPINI